MRYMQATATLLATVLANNGLVVQNPQRGQIERIADELVCNFQHYASMGDSYSVGLRSIKWDALEVCNGYNGNNTGPKYCTTPECAKNRGAYAWLYHKEYQPTNFDWFACSGANSTQWLQNQLPQLSSSTDLLSITIGGDDGNSFSHIVQDCIYNTLLHDLWPCKKFNCSKALENAKANLKTIPKVLQTTLSAINKTAPRAKIMLMGYVQLWSTTDDSHCKGISMKSVSAQRKTDINWLVSQYNTIAYDAVDSWNAANINTTNFINATFVDVDCHFEGHRFCDEHPYIQWDLLGNIVPSKIWPVSGVGHPNECGQETYLKALISNLGCTLPSRSWNCNTTSTCS